MGDVRKSMEWDHPKITPDMIRAGVYALQLGLREKEMDETIVVCVFLDMLRAERGDVTSRQVHRE